MCRSELGIYSEWGKREEAARCARARAVIGARREESERVSELVD